MPASVKAIVFKTTRLKASRMFFEEILHLWVKESSERHFVIHSKNIRLVFVESFSGFETEIYISSNSNKPPKQLLPDLTVPGLERYKDPNGIRVIVSRTIPGAK